MKFPRAFSLVEVLLAIAILAVGMTMVMAVFPAAIAEHRSSVHNVLGDIICKNGLVVTKLRVSRAEIPGSTLAPIPLGAADSAYPAGDANSAYGFIVLGRRLSPVRNEYQLVIIAYAKRAAPSEVRVEADTVFVTAGSKQLALPDNTCLKLHSPVIDAATGRFAIIKAINEETLTATLDHPLGVSGNRNLYFVREVPLAGPKTVVSPAMAVMVARTALSK